MVQRFWLCINSKVTSELTLWNDFGFSFLLTQCSAISILNGLHFPLAFLIDTIKSGSFRHLRAYPSLFAIFPKRELEGEELPSPRGANVVGTQHIPLQHPLHLSKSPSALANRPSADVSKPVHSSPFSWVFLPSPSAFLLATWVSPAGPPVRLRLLAPGW